MEAYTYDPLAEALHLCRSQPRGHGGVERPTRGLCLGRQRESESKIESQDIGRGEHGSLCRNKNRHRSNKDEDGTRCGVVVGVVFISPSIFRCGASTMMSWKRRDR